MKLKNFDELKDRLTDILMQFDKDCNPYQTDVYMYINNENKTAELELFENVGGNSWLDDDHITIYTDKEHYDDYSSYYPEIGIITDVLEIPYEQLREETLIYQGYEKHEIEDDTALSYSEVWDYVCNETAKGYSKKLYSAYCNYIDELRSDYLEKAETIMNDYSDIKYYSNNYDFDFCLIGTIAGSSKNVEMLNEYIELFDAKQGGTSLEDITDHLKENNILEYSWEAGENVLNENNLKKYLKEFIKEQYYEDVPEELSNIMKECLKSMNADVINIANIDDLIADLTESYISEQTFAEQEDGSFKLVSGADKESIITWLNKDEAQTLIDAHMEDNVTSHPPKKTQDLQNERN